MTSVFSIVSFPIREFGLKRSPLVFDHFERALNFLNLFTQLLFTTHAIQNSSDSAKYGHSVQRLILKKKKKKKKKGLLVEETRKNSEPCSSVEKVTSIHFKNLELFRM